MKWVSKEPRRLGLLDDPDLIGRSKIMIEIPAQKVSDIFGLGEVERLLIDDGLGMTEYLAVENQGVRFGFRTMIDSPNPQHASVFIKSAEQIDVVEAVRSLFKKPDLKVHIMGEDW